MVKKEISSVQNWKEAFWETALCSVNSSHRVTSFPSTSLSLRLFLWNWQRDIWKPLEAYDEKGNIFRSKLERSFLRNCFVMYEFISLIYRFLSWSSLLALFLGNLRRDVLDSIEANGDKGKTQIKLERSFWRNCFVMCAFISQRFTLFFPWISLLALFSWNLQRDIWEHTEAYGEKGNIFRSKLERSFLRNCSVFC